MVHTQMRPYRRTERTHRVEEARSTCASYASGVVVLPPDIDVQILSESQFAAFTRYCDVVETTEGIVYKRDGQPWQISRFGSRAILSDRRDALSNVYFEIV